MVVLMTSHHGVSNLMYLRPLKYLDIYILPHINNYANMDDVTVLAISQCSNKGREKQHLLQSYWSL